MPVKEEFGSASNSYLRYNRYPIVSINPGLTSQQALSVSSGGMELLMHKIAVIEITTSSGTADNNVILAGTASYYGAFKVKEVICDTSGALGLTFQDEDDADLLHTGPVALTVVEDVINSTIKDLVMFKGTDNKALEVDVTHDGGGTEKITMIVEYWYET